MDIKEFIFRNKEKIKKIAESNVKKNEKGQVVLPKDDEWREDNEWNNNCDKIPFTNPVSTDEVFKLAKENNKKFWEEREKDNENGI